MVGDVSDSWSLQWDDLGDGWLGLPGEGVAVVVVVVVSKLVLCSVSSRAGLGLSSSILCQSPQREHFHHYLEHSLWGTGPLVMEHKDMLNLEDLRGPPS